MRQIEFNVDDGKSYNMHCIDMQIKVVTETVEFTAYCKYVHTVFGDKHILQQVTDSQSSFFFFFTVFYGYCMNEELMSIMEGDSEEGFLV